MGSIYHNVLYCVPTSVMTRLIDSLEVKIEGYVCVINYGSTSGVQEGIWLTVRLTPRNSKPTDSYY